MIRAERQFIFFELIGCICQPLFGRLVLHLCPDGINLRRDFILDAIGGLLIEFAGGCELRFCSLHAGRTGDHLQISGPNSKNNYIARILDTQR